MKKRPYLETLIQNILFLCSFSIQEPGRYTIEIHVTKESAHGDVAIDDVTLTQGVCSSDVSHGKLLQCIYFLTSIYYV